MKPSARSHFIVTYFFANVCCAAVAAAHVHVMAYQLQTDYSHPAADAVPHSNDRQVSSE